MDAIFGFLGSFWQTSPPALRGLFVLVVGFLGAWLLRKLVEVILALLRFDKLADRIGIGEFLRKGAVPHRPAKLVSAIFGWVAILVTLLAASRALDITFVNKFSDNIVAALPGAIAAILVIIVGIILMSFLANLVETVARNAAWPTARLAGRVVWYVGTAIVLLLAFDQLGLGKSIVGSFFIIAFAAVALATALAFGLGGQGLAKEALENLLKKLRERDMRGREGDLED
ncbi:MAG TPA: hypothetical protein VMV44_15260 [Rectinemataceae bacterium]|nr:hypothetical protein [Rectinemataceae bacterium]